MGSSTSDSRSGLFGRIAPRQLGLVGQTSTSWGVAGGADRHAGGMWPCGRAYDARNA